MKALAFWINHQEQSAKRYRSLELIDEITTETPQRSSNTNGLRTIAKQVLGFFMPSNEPVISSHIDRSGYEWWNAYDPHTGRSIWFESEHELLAWIDRYPYS